MKPAAPDKCNGVTPLRVLFALVLCALLPLLAFAAAPEWWAQRGVTVPTAAADDYAPANQGQLKNIAKAAVAEMDAKLPGGAGEQLHLLVTGWATPSPQTNDFAPLNLGQLKNVAKPFYDRLIAAGLANAYPWTGSTAPADDFAVANIGQVKNLFSFEIGPANPLGDQADRIAASQRAGNLALAAQAVWFWGNRSAPDSTFPRPLTGLPASKSVSLGDDHFAILAADGTVLTWGKNNLGQLGDGTNADRTAPAPVPNLANIKSVKAGGAHTLALQQDGTVLAWGDNSSGQLGTGNTAPSNMPLQVPGLTGISKLAAGPARSVALKSDGTVWTWGYEHYAGGDIFNDTPVQMPDLLDVVDIAVGYGHVVAVKADGTVWAWGSNSFHQIGDGSSTGSYHQTPVQVPGLIDVVKVASSWDHTLAVTSDGTVWAWGYNFSGQLGDGTTQSHPGPVQVSGLTGVIAIATSYSYSMAMKADGTVWAWGDGASGTLPDVDLHVPQQVGLGLLDNNQNGMDDRWEMEYFSNLDQAGDADFDGDGISNLQEYLQGTDPTDYFNGTTPLIEIVSGNNQFGDAGTIAPQPLKVRVKSANGQLAPNAPVAFSVSSGDGQLISGSGSSESQMTVRTGADGIATIGFAFGPSNGVSNRVSALVGKLVHAVKAAFRLVTNYHPSPTPGPSATPGPTASPTASPTPPYRYAIIDLGKGVQPNRVNNKGTVLVHSWDENVGWVPSRWKGGVLELLTYTPENSGIWALDMNDEGVVVGAVATWGEWIDDAENEPEAGLQWPANSFEAVKVSAPLAAPSWDWRNPGTIRQGSFSALSNKNAAGQAKAYGRVRTGGGFGFLFSPFSVFNAYRWTDFGAPDELSHSVATPFFDSNNNIEGFTWTGFMDTVSRANSSDHYIGRQETPPPAEWWFIPEFHGPITGMIDGQEVDFEPEDLNEEGVVVGNRINGGPMVIRTLVVPPLAPIPDVLLPGAYPKGINTHVRPAAPASGSPTPVPAPQILGWDGSTTVLWERQPDTRIWHPFGLEEMIPNMDGWEIWDITDMNDDGVIVGSGSFKDPTNPAAQPEDHGFMLVPLEIMEDANDDKTINQSDRPAQAAAFGLWNEAYDSSGNVRNASPEVDNFVGLDKRRFYVKMINPSKNTNATTIDSFELEWFTTKVDGTDEDRPTGKLSLRETGTDTGVFVSKGIMLVTDDTDAQQTTNDGYGNMCARGALDHRIRKASINGSVNLSYSASSPSAAPNLTVPVFQTADLKRLKLSVVNYTAPPVGGAPATPYASPSYITGQVDHAQSRWAQLGLKIESLGPVQRPIPLAALNGTGNYSGQANTPEETVLLNDLIPVTADNTVTVVFLPLTGANAYTTISQRTSVSLGNRFFVFIALSLDLNEETLAHELFHALYNRFDSTGSTDKQFFAFNTRPPSTYGLTLPDVRVYRRIQLSTITPQNWLTTKRTTRFPIDMSMSVAGPATGNTLITDY